MTFDRNELIKRLTAFVAEQGIHGRPLTVEEVRAFVLTLTDEERIEFLTFLVKDGMHGMSAPRKGYHA